MTEPTYYAVGDTANGHVLTEQGWVPLPPAAAPVKKRQGMNIQKLGLGLFAVIFAVGLLTGVASEPSSSTTPDSAPASVVQEEKPAAQEAPAEEAPADVTPDLTVAQENAIEQAESYLSHSSFSKSGLIDQLEFEGYSTADAKFAVGHIEVDWNEQAAEQAKSYLSHSAFSRSGLIDQLEFEGFTTAQATFGADAVGL